ncbi:MAG: hypothetical protein ABI488_08040 [Polyangiaceae bacterium]
MSNSPTLPPVTALQRKPTPFPGLKVESDARLQAALAASARAEASLNGLFRSIQSLDSGVGGAKETNESLTQELEALREMLSLANEQQQAFKQKVALLEQALDRARKDGERDRAFLLEQQDSFIVTLLDDQEVVLKSRDNDLETLRVRVTELEGRATSTLVPPAAATSLPIQQDLSSPSATSAPSDVDRAERAELLRTAQKLTEDRERARETVQRLQAQRDEAQGAVARLSKERDEALQQVHRLKAELGGPRISTRPPSAESQRDAALFRIAPPAGKLPTLDTLPPVSSSTPAINSVLSPPPSNPNTAPLPARLSAPLPSTPRSRGSAPPEELWGALTNSPVTSTSSGLPALKQKPHPSTRPLVGYSMGNESVETEHLEGVRLASKPPGSDQR